MPEYLQKLKEYGADVDGALNRFAGDADLYKECVAMFMTDTEFDNLKRAGNDNNYADCFNAGHTLKGVCGNLGLLPLYEQLSILIELLRAEKYQDVTLILQSIQKERRRLIDTIGLAPNDSV